jgi:hypothetical protein
VFLCTEVMGLRAIVTELNGRRHMPSHPLNSRYHCC